MNVRVGSTTWQTIAAAGRPATTPGERATKAAVPNFEAGIVERLVRSPVVPRSSASARSTTRPAGSRLRGGERGHEYYRIRPDHEACVGSAPDLGDPRRAPCSPSTDFGAITRDNSHRSTRESSRGEPGTPSRNWP